MNSYTKGKFAEFISRLYMRLHGWKIISSNYTTGRGTTAGEIDFVAYRQNCIAFIEVKNRPTVDKAAYAISEKQKQRIIRGAQSFLKAHPQYSHCEQRFDAILFAPPYHLTHIKNAWLSE